MTDLESLIRDAFEPNTSRVDSDWDDVVRRARGRPARRPLAVLALAAFALAVGATALAETLGHGFSEWLTGKPGQPVSAEESKRFGEQNRSSSAPFPGETDLRELLRVEHDGQTYRLLGFRTGAAVCLKIAGADADEGGDVACVAADQLTRSNDLAVPLVVDKPVYETRPGDPPSPIATYGLVAAETRHVLLQGDDGIREVAVGNGAFLAVGPGTVIDHSTLRAFAVDESGRRHPVPLSPSLTIEIDLFKSGLPLRGPDRVERRVTGGTIGWLLRREPRGEPLPERLREVVAPASPPAENAPYLEPPAVDVSDFARMIQPHPADFLRMVLAVGRDDGHICSFLVSRGGVGGNCINSAAAFRGPLGPLVASWAYAGAGSQFLTLSGIASDDVARLELFLGTGEHWPVPLKDNAFVARVQRAKMPGRLVAYDDEGRVIGIAEQESY
jgi:hypothetical protein